MVYFIANVSERRPLDGMYNTKCRHWRREGGRDEKKACVQNRGFG